jgi:colanic acid biosynthesis glycosyl transferase WcaI
MKILIYSLNFHPELTGIGKYSGELAEWLAKKNHEVRVITAPPYYPNWKIGDGYKSWLWRFERLSNVSIWRCPVWIPVRPSGIKRILHLLSFAFSSIPIALSQIFWRPNVVLVVEPPLFAAPLALILAKICHSRSILHIQDYEIDAAFELGMLKGARLRRFVLYLECAIMRSFDVVSTISSSMLSKAKNKRVESKKLLIFPNWVDVPAFDVSNSDDERFAYRERLGIPHDKIVALYSGNMGAKQGLESLAELAIMCNSNLNLASVYFVFCGSGVGREMLFERTQNLTNVKFLDLQPAALLPKFFNMIDIHLLPQRADIADLVMPSKLTGMLASGRPVLASANAGTELAKVLDGLGIVVEPGNLKALFDGFMRLYGDSALRSRLGIAGRIYAQKYLDREKVLFDFENYLLKLVK